VELLGHHGVTLQPRSSMSSNEPSRPVAPQVPSTSYYVAPPTVPQSNMEQNFQDQQVSMSFQPLGYSHEAQRPITNDQSQVIQQPFNDNAWSGSPVEHLPGAVVRQTVVSPSNEASHGTLVISASGRSKYLGPSAASEWLKDVSCASLGSVGGI
jgi:hypothetical protein